MHKLFKLAFKLGYKFAEREYYQKLIMSLRTRSQYEHALNEMKDVRTPKTRQTQLAKSIDIDNALGRIIDEAFSRDTFAHPLVVRPFEDDINQAI